MWPFILTRTLTMEKPIVASKSDVLSILHDPKRVLANNAMAVSVVQDASDPSLYTITDRLPLIGSWGTHTTIKSRWTKTTNGCDVEVYANLWTRVSNELGVRELDSPEGTVLYYEKVVVKVQYVEPFYLFYPQCSQFLRAYFCSCLTSCPLSSKVMLMPQTYLLRNWRA